MTTNPHFIQPDNTAVKRGIKSAFGQPQAPWLYTEVARRMQERLTALKNPPQVIFNWWGTWGGSASILERAYPKAKIHHVEPVAYECYTAARPRHTFSAWWKRFTSGRSPTYIDTSVPVGHADGVWANMMLHLAPDVPQLLAQWKNALQTHGVLMFSTLGPDSMASLRSIYARKGWGFPAQEFADMHHLGDALVKAGYADPVVDQEHLTLTWTDAKALLAELRTWGVNAHPQRHQGLRSRQWYAQLIQALDELKQPDGRLALELEIIYGHAIKPRPKVEIEAVSHIPLAQMREMVRQSRNKN
jgi:malonyl-CoA O-methyltransferase